MPLVPLLGYVTKRIGIVATITTSFYDFDTPTVDKAFKSIEFSMNSAVATTGLTVAFKLDNLSNAFTPMTLQVSPSGNTLIAYFPPRSIGHRVQFQFTVANGPDIQGISVLATLARTWTFTVAARRSQASMNPSDQTDIQQVSAQALAANIMNAYLLAAGNITLWMPDPTVASTPGGKGPMAEINAQIQDYKRVSTSSGGAGWHRDAQGLPDFDEDIELVITEIL